MDEKKCRRFDEAVQVLSPRIRELAIALPDSMKSKVQEIRLRLGQPIVLIESGGTCFLKSTGRPTYLACHGMAGITTGEMVDTFQRMCGFSVHSCQASLAQGYLSIPGGHRAGICGTIVEENGGINSIRDITSISLRIAQEYPGCAQELLDRVMPEQEVNSFLLAGPPSSGKTTLLRDLARLLSSGVTGRYFKTVLIDERGELAAAGENGPIYDIGYNCDVLSRCPKTEGILMAVRTLSPDMIICDEIGSAQEADAIRAGLHCGVRFVASIHASNELELKSRLPLRMLLETEAFRLVVLLKGEGTPGRIDTIYRAEDLLVKTHGDSVACDVQRRDRPVFQPFCFSQDSGARTAPNHAQFAANRATISTDAGR